MKTWHPASLAFVALSLILFGSCALKSPTHYGEILIDTYLPNSIMSFTPNTTISLFGSNGTLAAAIATDTGGNLNGTYGKGAYARVDYTGGLDSGKYYIKVNSNGIPPNNYGAYAIRILTSLPVPEYSAGDEFSVINPLVGAASPDSYEPDDAVGGDGVPTNPVAISIGDRLNRSLLQAGGDVDWFVLTLP
jgi:hypothetical protein